MPIGWTTSDPWSAFAWFLSHRTTTQHLPHYSNPVWSIDQVNLLNQIVEQRSVELIKGLDALDVGLVLGEGWLRDGCLYLLPSCIRSVTWYVSVHRKSLPNWPVCRCFLKSRGQIVVHLVSTITIKKPFCFVVQKRVYHRIKFGSVPSETFEETILGGGIGRCVNSKGRGRSGLR